jgi:hypothetical protein
MSQDERRKHGRYESEGKGMGGEGIHTGISKGLVTEVNIWNPRHEVSSRLFET